MANFHVKPQHKNLSAQIKSAALALLMIFPVVPAYAVGTGPLKVKSTLDEPLLVEIPLKHISAAELASTKVKLGSEADFKKAGVNRVPGHQHLKFKISKTEASGPRVVVTTDQPVKEPYLHFLVEISWKDGKMVREYTALLDPPLYSPYQPVTVTSPPSAVSSPGASRPSSRRFTPATSGGDDRQTVQFGEYGPTRRGDTLWAIASNLQRSVSGTSIFQVMHALLKENPDAFVGNNINRLKTGAILRLDDLGRLRQISNREARVAYTEQLEVWQAYKLALAETSPNIQVDQGFSAANEVAEPSVIDAPSAPVEVDTKTRPASDPDTAEDIAQVGTTTQAPVDVLKIVRETVKSEAGDIQDTAASDDVKASAEVGVLRSQITTLEEELLSRELENTELMERLELLELQVQNTKRLLTLEDAQLALAQQQAREQAERELADLKAGRETMEVVPTSASAKVAETDTPMVIGEVMSAEHDEGTSTEDMSASIGEDQGLEKVRVSRADRPSTAWWSGLWQSLEGQWEKLVAALGGLMALIVGLVLLRRRRQSADEYENSVLMASELIESELAESSTLSDTAAGSSQLVGDTSFLSEIGATDGGQLKVDDVDPIAEVEVYLAYGRDEQAEEVLKEAITKYPDRHELKLKLLEIFQQREDLGAFETLSETLNPETSSASPEIWDKVVVIGRAMNSKNPLFKDEAITEAAPPSKPAEVTVTEEESDLDDLNLSSQVDSALSKEESSLQVAADGESAIQQAIDGADIDLDVGGGMDTQPIGESQDLNLDDLTIDADGVLVSRERASKDVEVISIDSEAISGQIELSSDIELPADEIYEPEEAEDTFTATEAQTKLDLARAYIDMGDQIGAIDILEEVVKHGNAAQKQQANDLAEQLAS